MDKMREEFEKWVRSKGHLPMRIGIGRGEGKYCNLHVDRMWQAWQASRQNIKRLPYIEDQSELLSISDRDYNYGYESGLIAYEEHLELRGFNFIDENPRNRNKQGE